MAQLNYFPIGGQAVALVGEVIFSYLADTTGRHLLLLQVHSVRRGFGTNPPSLCP